MQIHYNTRETSFRRYSEVLRSNNTNKFIPSLNNGKYFVHEQNWTHNLVLCRHYMHLPITAQKPCVYVYSSWEDRAYRLHHSNMLDTIALMFVCEPLLHCLFLFCSWLFSIKGIVQWKIDILITNILQNIFFHFQQKKKRTNTGLERLINDLKVIHVCFLG